MDAVFSLASIVSVLVSARIVASGTPAESRKVPTVQRTYLGDQDETVTERLLLTIVHLAAGYGGSRGLFMRCVPSARLVA